MTVVRPTEAASGGSTANTETSVDLGKRLISNGLGVVEKRRPGNDRRLQSLISQYQEAQDSAKKSRVRKFSF